MMTEGQKGLVMPTRFQFRAGVTAAIVFLGATGLLFSQEPGKKDKEKKTEPFTTLTVHVTGENGQDKKPAGIPGAEVRVSSEVVDKDYDETSLTNGSGFVQFKKVPHGMVKVQVTAEGWKTFGKRYKLAEQTQIIEVSLTRED